MNFASSSIATPGITSRGQTVYLGSVFPLKADATHPTYVYERRVDGQGGERVSTHITRQPSGALALVESATESVDRGRVEYTLHRNQLGQSGTIRVEQGQVSFRLVDGSRVRSRTERQAGPVVVGPTLIGHILGNIDRIRAGEVARVRLAVLDRLETIGFELQSVKSEPGQTRVRMKPTSLLLALVVDPIYFTFDTPTGKLVRLEGRVPPKIRAGDRWRDLDARVEYRFVADRYL